MHILKSTGIRLVVIYRNRIYTSSA